MFRKKLDIEVLNLFNTIENKIDTINSKFNCVTFLDGCCNCKEREVKVNEMLITFLESKFDNLYVNENELLKNHIDSILMEVKTELKNTLVSKADHKSSLEPLTESITNLTNEIEQLKQTQKIKQLEENINSLKISIEKCINDIDNVLSDFI